MKNIKYIILITLLFNSISLYSQREEIKLNHLNTWKIWLDKNAEWENDKLYLPDEFKLSDLPENPPTCGWQELYNHRGKFCKLPTTIEEQFGTDNSWSYHGVSWFFTTINIPKNWYKKNIFLKIEKYNHRIEIYINDKLAGYDAIGLLPYQCDITGKLISGKKNKIALRITSAGGNRGWEDFHLIKWGNQYLLADKDYSGIGGELTLSAVDQSYITDVFVENLQPAKGNNINVNLDIQHNSNKDVQTSYNIRILEKESKKVIYNHNFTYILQKGQNKISKKISIPKAKQWDEYNPNLYICDISLKTPNSCDTYQQTFGFRVFEIKEKNNHTHYYLNGKRIRLKSAIDWSIYAFNGLFPTYSTAERSIQAVKALGHNSLNFHRRAGDRIIFEKADSLGVYIYEEPGGFHSGGQANCNIDTILFAKAQIYERLKRMVKRDRNHPSLLIYSLSNEDNMWTNTKEKALKIIHNLDSTRLIVNTSGGNNGGFSDGGIAHIRPYSDEIRMDYNDHHTVLSNVRLDENDINLFNYSKGDRNKIEHVSNDSTKITYWGEVRCYAGTFNYPLIYKQRNKNKLGYDLSMYKSQAEKVSNIFKTCRLKGAGHGDITSEYELTKYAGQGQYYTNGRLEQVIMSDNFSDGFAINGWTPGPDMPDEWSSAMLDQNRNMNSFEENISYWNRPLQIAIIRTNGKYVNPGDTVKLNIFLINENKLSAGTYTLSLKIKDGSGKYVKQLNDININVISGDTFSQTISKGYSFTIDRRWISGYITIEGSLYKNGNLVTDGKEQVLLKNRPSQTDRFKGKKIAIINWPKAQQAINEANIETTNNINKASVILLGTNSTKQQWDIALSAVRKGSNLIIQTCKNEAHLLYEKELINSPITVWGGLQTPFWNGNGSSYIDTFGGNQVMHKSHIISTRSWETDGDPVGFYPFTSKHKIHTYGLYFAHQYKRNENFKNKNNVLITYGEIEYGRGRILINTSYWVDNENAFSDLLFFNMLNHYTN